MTLDELISEIGKGQILCASPAQCFLRDGTGRIGLNIEPGLCRRLIQEAGWQLSYLPQFSWYENGRLGWRDMVAPAFGNAARFDFFVLTQ